MLKPVEVAIAALGSVRDVALTCRVTHGAVSQWRTHGLIPSHHLPALLERLKPLGVSAEELIRGRNDSAPP